MKSVHHWAFKIGFCLIIYLKITESIKTLSTCQCGAANTPIKNRIVGGVNTSPHEYPWVVSILDSNNDVYCGGSIISDRHILTAGHCVYYTDPFQLHAMLGMHDRILQDGSRYDFEEVLLNPEFKALDMHDTSDLAIIKTDKKIKFTKFIKPICLPADTSYSYDGEKATLAGWGRMWSNGENSRYLQETSLIIQSANKCKNTQIGSFLEVPTMICGYATNADACQGDSGGPLFLETSFNRYEQFGIVSFGIGCATEYSPGIYTRVTKFLPWIRAVIDEASTCRDTGLPFKL